jgi:hypothetical protein
MALNVSLTADCKKAVVTVTGAAGDSQNSVQISLGDYSYDYNFPGGATNTRVVNLATQLANSATGYGGVMTVTHLEGGVEVATSAVLVSCDILCCLAKKMEDLLDCNCECMKCSDDLVSAQKIFLLLKTAEAELATASGTLLERNAVIANAEKKYNKAAEMCSGHCGCNC